MSTDPNGSASSPLINNPVSKDFSYELLLSPFITRDLRVYEQSLSIHDLFGVPSPTGLEDGITNVVSSAAINTSPAFSDTLILDFQPHAMMNNDSPLIYDCNHPNQAKHADSPMAIKATPIKAMSPNGTIHIFLKAPSTELTKRRRIRSRLFNSEEGSDISARIEKAEEKRLLESDFGKKLAVPPQSPLGFIDVPFNDITEDEIGLLSTATGYVFPKALIDKLTNHDKGELDSQFI